MNGCSPFGRPLPVNIDIVDIAPPGLKATRVR
jgi:hypothetical protein